MWILWLLICSVRWILLHFWVANVWVMMYINSLILSSEGFICLLLMHWPRKRNNIALFPINVFKLSKLRKLAYKVLLFHYYLILPYKVKTTCKIWGHNTLHCSVLVLPVCKRANTGGLDVNGATMADRIRVFWILLPKNRGQNNIFFQ